MSWRRWTDRVKHSQKALQLADTLGRGKGRLRWLDHLYSAPRPSKPDLSDWENRELAVAWLGHATVLLRIGGMTVLTDPVLPDELLPADWPGTRLRAAYNDFAAELIERRDGIRLVEAT